MPTGTQSNPARDIRQRRESIGVSRAVLARHSDCSLTYLASLEAGIVPRLSLVLPRVLAALDRLELEAVNSHGPEKRNAATGTRGAAANDDLGGARSHDRS